MIHYMWLEINSLDSGGRGQTSSMLGRVCLKSAQTKLKNFWHFIHIQTSKTTTVDQISAYVDNEVDAKI